MPALSCDSQSPAAETTITAKGPVCKARAGHRGERGQSLVEFAMALPVMLLIVMGICAFGITISHYMILTDATNIGGRQLAIIRGQTTDPCKDISNTVIASSPSLSSSAMTFKFVINGSSYTGTTCSAGASALTAGVTASLTVTYSSCSLIAFGTNFAPNCSLQAQDTELVQ